MDYDPILGLMEGPGDRRLRYRRWVETGLAGTDEEFAEILASSRLAMGSSNYLDRIQRLYQQMARKRVKSLDVALRRAGWRVKPEEIEKAVGEAFDERVDDLQRPRRDGTARSVLSYLLCKYAGMRQREVATRLGVATGAAVSD